MAQRILFFILLLIMIHPIFGQTPISSQLDNNLSCDTIIFKNGNLMTCKIQEIKKNKILYYLCCPNCSVPRKVPKSEIDTVILSKRQALETNMYIEETPQYLTESTIDRDTSKLTLETEIKNINSHFLMLKRRNGKNKNIIISESSRLKIIFKNGDVIKGKIRFSNEHEILIEDQIIEISELSAVVKKSKEWMIFSGITGTATTITTIWLSMLGIPVIAVPISASLFTLMFIAKKYKMSKFEIYLLYQ